MHVYDFSLAGEIGKLARVVAMHMGGWLRAFRARSTRLTRSQNQGQSFAFQMDINKTEIDRQREQGDISMKEALNRVIGLEP